jgi:hypothetical protein
VATVTQRGTLGGVTKEVLALALTVLVHVIGMAALVWALLLDDENRPDWRGWWPGGDDEPPAPPPPGPSGDGLPLRDAEPSAVRLREHGNLADAHPRPARRPAHAPQREPVRERERD